VFASLVKLQYQRGSETFVKRTLNILPTDTKAAFSLRLLSVLIQSAFHQRYSQRTSSTMVVTKRHGHSEDGSSMHQDTSIDDRDMQRMALPSELRVSTEEKHIPFHC
jgi:hypothetical protein